MSNISDEKIDDLMKFIKKNVNKEYGRISDLINKDISNDEKHEIINKELTQIVITNDIIQIQKNFINEHVKDSNILDEIENQVSNVEKYRYMMKIVEKWERLKRNNIIEIISKDVAKVSNKTENVDVDKMKKMISLLIELHAKMLLFNNSEILKRNIILLRGFVVTKTTLTDIISTLGVKGKERTIIDNLNKSLEYIEGSTKKHVVTKDINIGMNKNTGKISTDVLKKFESKQKVIPTLVTGQKVIPVQVFEQKPTLKTIPKMVIKSEMVNNDKSTLVAETSEEIKLKVLKEMLDLSVDMKLMFYNVVGDDDNKIKPLMNIFNNLVHICDVLKVDKMMKIDVIMDKLNDIKPIINGGNTIEAEIELISIHDDVKKYITYLAHLHVVRRRIMKSNQIRDNKIKVLKELFGSIKSNVDVKIMESFDKHFDTLENVIGEIIDDMNMPVISSMGPVYNYDIAKIGDFDTLCDYVKTQLNHLDKNKIHDVKKWLIDDKKWANSNMSSFEDLLDKEVTFEVQPIELIDSMIESNVDMNIDVDDIKNVGVGDDRWDKYETIYANIIQMPDERKRKKLLVELIMEMSRLGEHNDVGDIVGDMRDVLGNMDEGKLRIAVHNIEKVKKYIDLFHIYDTVLIELLGKDDKLRELLKSIMWMQFNELVKSGDKGEIQDLIMKFVDMVNDELKSV